MTRTKFIAAALLTVSLAVPTATAVAADAVAKGAHAWSPADGGDSGKIAVKDNSSDGDPVKAEYYTGGQLGNEADPVESQRPGNHRLFR
ncbi:hypothetical protein [Streptomyces sp. BE133]|uniref:hypothetical protein n=1 Tax=Streptomyces sp. BE133 TaxID=3002523 RepID=UPI002E771410|nr:hypothetical protein [Streptomyces sp. BE133]MEE1804838.1 hypothetical protein [Streptomyces sp. BE133]